MSTNCVGYSDQMQWSLLFTLHLWLNIESDPCVLPCLGDKFARPPPPPPLSLFLFLIMFQGI